MKELKTVGELTRDIHAIPASKSKTREILLAHTEHVIKVIEAMKVTVKYKGTGTPSQRAINHNAALSQAQDLLKRTI